MVHPTPKPLSAEAKRKRTRGEGGRRGGECREDKAKWAGWKTNV